MSSLERPGPFSPSPVFREENSMNATRWAALVLACGLTAAPAQAGGRVSVGIGIGLPLYGGYGGYGGGYYRPYCGGYYGGYYPYYRPYPVYVAPPPLIVQAAPVVQQVPVVQPTYSS